MKHYYGLLIGLTVFVGICAFSGYAIWQIYSDEGRWGRDLYAEIHGIDASDDTVKGDWCGFKGFPQPYSNQNGKEYCGDVEVKMDCIFTNSGDHCTIEKVHGGIQ